MKTGKEFQFFTLGLVIVLDFVFAQAALSEQPAMPSQSYTWKNVKVVAGGFIPGIVYSQKQPGLMYCRTDIGSSYRFDSVTKKWIPLTDWCGVSNLMGSESIAADPVDANRVYIAAGMGSSQPAAILRSMDQGKTFQVVDVPFRMGGNENGRSVGERLAIDSNFNDILYFGSRRDGLWMSADAAITWKKVDCFPIQGSAAPASGFGGGQGRNAGAGLSFVVFDPSTGSPGAPTRTIYVGATERSDAQLYRSTDAGKSWEAVPGQPKEFVPIHAQFDPSGVLYLVYDNGVGPNGITSGAVWKYNSKDNTWIDITPDKAPNRTAGGYGGLGIDRQHPGTIMVATLDHWSGGGDRLYRSTDGGMTWKDISEKTKRDGSLSPYIIWGKSEPALGWWIATLAIDPFDSNRVCYATGATIWGSSDIANADSDQPTNWSVWADGIEETAILDLTSPTEGAHLISAFGDIGGYTHDDLDVSPPNGMHQNPLFGNTNTVDFAEKNPNVIIRTGTPRNNGGTMAYSEDGGHAWKTFNTGASTGESRGGFGRGNRGGVIINADGGVFMNLSGAPSISKDRGQTWTPCLDLPRGVRPVADRVNPNKFFAINDNKVYTSTDSGASFSVGETTGLPDAQNESSTEGNRGGSGGFGARWRLRATLGKESDLWLFGRNGLLHSSDGGASFIQIPNVKAATAIGFGKAASGKDFPAVFLAGTIDGLNAIYRSDDIGSTWVRINDDQHQYGTRFRCIAGDPRIYGRVYVGTDGRGIVYGGIAQ
jgi:xyloglucan-specific exo-beta-1,4-glucanase